MIKLGKLGYFTATEAADFMDIPRQSFYRLKDKGSLPDPVLIQGRMIIWKKSDIKKVKKILGITRGKKK